MPQYWPEQILQQIVRFSADGNSQQEVARMLGVSPRMHKQNFAIQPRDWPTTSEEAWRFDENLHATGRLSTVTTNRFILAPRLRMQMIRRFGRQMSVRTIQRWILAAGYWFRRPARCPRLTLEHRRRRREWGRRHRVWDLRQWRHCVFSDKSWFSLYYSAP